MYVCMILTPNITSRPCHHHNGFMANGALGHTHVRLCAWTHPCTVIYVSRINTKIKTQKQVGKGSSAS